MTLRSYLIIMSISDLTCWLIWGYILWTINPEITNWIGFFLFYFSLFLALTGVASLIGFAVRFIFLKQELVFHLVKEAFRQSFLFAFLIIVSLFLLSKGLFNWFNVLFLIIGLSALEFALISYGERKG